MSMKYVHKWSDPASSDSGLRAHTLNGSNKKVSGVTSVPRSGSCLSQSELPGALQVPYSDGLFRSKKELNRRSGMKIFFPSLLMLADCSGGIPAAAQSGDAAVEEISGVGQGRLSKHDLEAALKRTEAGDLNAMSKLEEHYAADGDKSRYVYWLDAQISKSSSFAMQRKAAYLASIGNDASCREAKTLLENAVRAADDEELREELKQELLLLEGKIAPEAACGN